MISSYFHFAKLTNAAKIVLPLSFGPFAYRWQERLTARVLYDFDIVAARESFSFHTLQKYKVPYTILSSDTALLLKAKRKEKRTRNFIVGFTIRNWFDENRQNIFDQHFIDALTRFAKETNSSVQPILQVVGDKYGESDKQITEKISRALEKKNVEVLKIHKILTLEDFLIYSQMDLLLGMRMHSNILAAVHGTPFVAISYEHKTEGIAYDLGMDDYVINCKTVTAQNLYELLMKAYKNRAHLNKTIDNSLSEIRQKETARWHTIFQALC